LVAVQQVIQAVAVFGNQDDQPGLASLVVELPLHGEALAHLSVKLLFEEVLGRGAFARRKLDAQKKTTR